MMRVVLRAALLGLSFCVSTQALARVEVKPAHNNKLGEVLAIRVTEDIAPGDYEALLRDLRAHPGKFARKIALLDSIGGSVSEAMRMGRLLRESGFDTWVPTNSVCQGSCVYLLVAGRQKHVSGYVGLHRPYFPKGDSMLANSAAGSAFGAAAYLREMGAPQSLFDDMQRIDPGKLRLLSKDDLARYRLQ
ncbi:MAG: hypothetical protein GAK44_00130 [Pseudomonas delhiensis]|nr:MAG: hypothetical protein GAK44_00130 [Pseudomonas delhiensis]